MDQQILEITKDQLKKDLPEVKPGDLIRVHQKIKEGDKERIQVFEGRVIARKHGKGINATITVRRVIDNIGVEKIFPLHSPLIEKIEILQRGKTRRAKLYYLRDVSPKKARLKKIEMKEAVIIKEALEESSEINQKESSGQTVEESDKEISREEEKPQELKKEASSEKLEIEKNKEK